MDEYIELLDEDNTPNGKRCLKSIAHKNGLYHASVHIWLYTKDNQILIQKRQTNKQAFPNLWDVSVAGHIAYKELPSDAAIRETAEEIGLKIEHSDLRNIGTSTSKHIHSEEFIDRELHHLYICPLQTELSDLNIQISEVSEIKLIPIDVFRFELKNNSENYVPN